MDYVTGIIDFLKSDAGVGMLGGLLAISEALAKIKALEANSILELVTAILKKLIGK